MKIIKVLSFPTQDNRAVGVLWLTQNKSCLQAAGTRSPGFENNRPHRPSKIHRGEGVPEGHLVAGSKRKGSLATHLRAGAADDNDTPGLHGARCPPAFKVVIQMEPKGRVFDLGVVDLPIQTTVHNSFDMPFDGYIVRVDASWPAGALNAIGFKLMSVPGGILIPHNPEVEYVADDDTHVPFYPVVEKLPKGSTVTAEIRNESTTNPLDLQIRVTVTNFDPRLMRRV